MQDTHREYRLSVACCLVAVLLVLCVCGQRRAFSQDVVAAVLNENAAYRNAAVDYSSCSSWQDSEFSVCNDTCCNTAGAGRSVSGRFRGTFRRGWHNVRCDYRNYYSWHTARDFLLCVGSAAVMANTTIDEKFQHWVQDDVRSSGSDDFARFWKTFGEGQIFIPAWAGLAVAGSMLDEWPVMGTAGDFGSRTTRSYLVGGPPMLFMQLCLGGSRPGECSHGSDWRPFDDSNGVSGHAFIGAVPFITAAQMSENRCVKGCFYLMSTLPGWSRINDDSHYLSQAWMGWWMAYLSCRSVNETEQGKNRLAIAPILAPGTVGMMFEYRR